MKLRKCLLWQTQRPSIGITSRAWNVDTIRDGLSGHLRGNAASDGSRYTPLTVFLDAKKNTKEKKENSSKDFTVSIGKFAEPWMLHSKLGDNIYRYTGIPGIYEHFYLEEGRFLSRVTRTYIRMYGIFHILPNFFVGLSNYLAPHR